MNTPSLFSITLGRFIKNGTDSGTIAAECVLGGGGVLAGWRRRAAAHFLGLQETFQLQNQF